MKRYVLPLMLLPVIYLFHLNCPAPAGIADGVAWKDANGDGVRQENEELLPGVTVRLYRFAVGGQKGIGLFDLVSTEVTDGNGSYFFVIDEDETYFVEFVSPNELKFTTQNAGTSDRFDSDPDPTTGATRPFIARTDPSRGRNIDAGFVDAVGGAVDVVVFHDVNADGVLNDDEKRLTGTPVSITLRDFVRDLKWTVVTDTGLAKFDGLIRAEYRIEGALGFGGMLSPQVDDPLGSVVDPLTGMSKSIVIDGQRFTLHLGAIEVGGAKIVTGIMFEDEDDDGERDPSEIVLRDIPVILADSIFGPIRATTTDANGRYAFSNVENPGMYSISVPSIAGLNAPDEVCEVVLRKGPQPPQQVGIVVEFAIVVGDDEIIVNVPFPPTLPFARAIYRGRVWNDKNGDGIFDAGTEETISLIPVELVNANTGAVLDRKFTDSSGMYEVADLGVDGLNLQVRVEQSLGRFTLRDVGADDSVDSDVDRATGLSDALCVPNGADVVRNVDAGILFPDDLVDQIGSVPNVAGTVWDDKNRNGFLGSDEPRRAGVQVILRELNSSQETTTTTAENGFYQFNDVAPGDYVIKVVPPTGTGFSPNMADSILGTIETDSNVDPGTGESVSFSIEPGETSADLRFIDAGLVTTQETVIGDFVWIDSNLDGIQNANETGIAGITVGLLNPDFSVADVTQTIEGGFYEFRDFATPAMYYVQVSLSDDFMFTIQDQGGDDRLDSDFDPSTGRSPLFSIDPGGQDFTIDAGLIFRLDDGIPGEGAGEGVGEGAGEGMGEGEGDGAGEGSGEGFGEGIGEGSGEGIGEGIGEEFCPNFVGPIIGPDGFPHGSIRIILDPDRTSILQVQMTLDFDCTEFCDSTVRRVTLESFAVGEVPIVKDAFNVTLSIEPTLPDIDIAGTFESFDVISGDHSSMGPVLSCEFCTSSGTFTASFVGSDECP